MHRRLGWLLWTITLGQVALALALAFLNGFNLTRLFAEYVVSQALGAIAFASVGALIVERRRRNPIGWLYCALGLGFGWACWLSQYAHYSLVTAPGTRAGRSARWLAESLVGRARPADCRPRRAVGVSDRSVAVSSLAAAAVALDPRDRAVQRVLGAEPWPGRQQPARRAQAVRAAERARDPERPGAHRQFADPCRAHRRRVRRGCPLSERRRARAPAAGVVRLWREHPARLTADPDRARRLRVPQLSGRHVAQRCAGVRRVPRRAGRHGHRHPAASPVRNRPSDQPHARVRRADRLHRRVLRAGGRLSELVLSSPPTICSISLVATGLVASCFSRCATGSSVVSTAFCTATARRRIARWCASASACKRRSRQKRCSSVSSRPCAMP